MIEYTVYATEIDTNKEKVIGTWTTGQIAISMAYTFATQPDFKNVRVELKPKEKKEH